MQPEDQQQTPPVQNDPQIAPEQPPVAPEPAPVAEPAAPAEVEVAAPAAPTPAPVEEENDEFDIPTFNLYPQAPYQYQASQQQTEPPAQQPPQQAQPQATQVPALDPGQFTNNLGEVDMGKFTQALEARDRLLMAQAAEQATRNVMQHIVPAVSQEASRTVLAAKREEQLWNKVFDKYPEIKSNKDLRDLVHKTRLGEFQTTGKETTPLKAAERLFKHLGSARQEGQQQATESVRIQASAHLETAANTASDKAVEARDNFAQIGARDRRVANSARESLLKQWLSDGKI